MNSQFPIYYDADLNFVLVNLLNHTSSNPPFSGILLFHLVKCLKSKTVQISQLNQLNLYPKNDLVDPDILLELVVSGHYIRS